MSLVRISNSLIDDVKNCVKAINDKVMESTVLPTSPIKNQAITGALFDLAEKKLWGEHMHLKNTMPAKWLTKVMRVDIIILNSGLPEIQLDRPIECPPGTTSYSYVDVKLDANEVPAYIIDDLKAYKAREADHRSKFIQVEAQTKAFLQSCKSLNDAMKKYPDIALYVPQHYINRVNTKDARAAKADEVVLVTPVIDRDLVTSLGVVGKLHGAD